MYTCGPTVYNFAHIGNMRAYIAADLLKRTLAHNGYRVKHVMNITDVGHLVSDANLGEDKIRMTAQHEHKSVYEVAKFYTEEFIKDMKLLNLIIPDVMPKATDHVRDMLEIIYKLDEKGFLYKVATGMYFDTSKFKSYGQLMGLGFEDLNNYLVAGARVERAAGIRNITDFAVWRFAKGEEKEMVWDSKYGRGFPGWHIECSAMSMKYLGEHFDVHTGGIDHLPVHHTNEIAQSETATGKKFVDFWIHSEFLLVNGKKMSKSLGNVYTLQHLEEKGHSAMAFKYFVLAAYYRSQINFTFDALRNAENTLNGIYLFIEKIAAVANSGPEKRDKALAEKAARISDEFFEGINNDLNTSLALSKMHMLVSEANKAYEKGMSKADAKTVLDAIIGFDDVLGLQFKQHAHGKAALNDEIKQLIGERNRLRKEGKFAEADKIRARLRNEFKIGIEDTGSGTVWHKL